MSTAPPTQESRDARPGVAAYLARIGYTGGTEPTLHNLRAMHRAHFFSVPFENLDIARGVPIVVDETVNTDKIVRRRRGGFCLELTSTFARVLRALGYRVDVIGAHVTAPLSHMVAIVHLDERWLVDVGFGGRVAEPLRLDERGPQHTGIRTYTVAHDDGTWTVTCAEPGTPPGSYSFVMQPRSFDEFEAVCNWLQTSPESRFTHGDVVSLATPAGRVTLADERLIVNEDGVRTETAISSREEKTAILRERFGITIDP
jgi:N-hydroxyarylamine O-acetyltransferase